MAPLLAMNSPGKSPGEFTRHIRGEEQHWNAQVTGWVNIAFGWLTTCFMRAKWVFAWLGSRIIDLALVIRKLLCIYIALTIWLLLLRGLWWAGRSILAIYRLSDWRGQSGHMPIREPQSLVRPAPHVFAPYQSQDNHPLRQGTTRAQSTPVLPEGVRPFHGHSQQRKAGKAREEKARKL